MSASPDGDEMSSTRRKQGDTILLLLAIVKLNIAIKRFFRRSTYFRRFSVGLLAKKKKGYPELQCFGTHI